MNLTFSQNVKRISDRQLSLIFIFIFSNYRRHDSLSYDPILQGHRIPRAQVQNVNIIHSGVMGLSSGSCNNASCLCTVGVTYERSTLSTTRSPQAPL